MTTDTPAQSVGCRIMTFTPSKEEFKDFSRYIAYMESQGAHKAGMAKVIPPKDWKPRRTYDDIDDLVIPAPIQQVVTGQSGLFTQYNIQKKPMTVLEFRKTSNLDKFCNPRYVDFDELERKFWKNLTFNPPLYGADVSGTLYDPDVTEWNIGHLNTILDTVESDSGIKIKGVNTPYLYFGMWKSAFAWHTEDMDLYSINYLHFGEPKSWYVVPPEHGKRLERLAKGFFPGNAQSCEAFLRHKMTLISPSILKKYGIPFEKVTQEAGQFIVTFPYGYHAGFNHGFNCAESTNFATQRWIDYGKQATLCSCRQDMVKISMDVFVRKFQPDRYKLWKAGKDNASIDHSKPTPEAAEFLREDKSEPSEETATEAGPEETTPPVVQEDKSPKPQTGTKRQLEVIEASEDIKPEVTMKETEEVEPKKAKLSHKESPTQVPVKPDKDTVKFKIEPKKEKDTKPQTKSQSKASTKKTGSRQSTPKKEKNGVSDVCPPEPSESQVVALSSEEAGGSDEPRLGSSYSPPHKLFQRTLSPTDVLHVHSYAKGDYGDGEAPPKEEKRSEGSDNKTEKDNRHVSKAQVAEEMALDGEQENDLGQLPGHHPLIKDGMSDEEAPGEAPILEEGGLEGESWAKPLTHLWQSRPPNLKKERDYNQRMGSKSPYCSICILFHTYFQTECANSVDSPVIVASGRMRTKPLIPEMCFTTTTEEDSECEEQPVTPHLEEDGTSLLISCSQCSIRVHTSCYGVDPASLSKEWKCARCKANAMNENCCLCSLRGGALQKANNNKWVHVLCAVAVLEARFVNITERSPVDLSGIPLQRFKLKCYYCKKRMKKASGCCVQCSHGRCPTAYHPTCAQAAGVLMQPDEWPFVVHVTCCRHKGPTQIERNKAVMHELTVGQKVICKHKNGRYYQCDVVQLSKETFYEVNFDDGSFSDNLFPEDIVSRDCAQLGPPPQGEVVQVRWTDGLVYGAKFVAAHAIHMYLVEFEDGSQLTAKRDDVYSLDEELPKRVKSRLSKASDMRFDGIFEEKEIIRESKRQRVINSRYRGDYIEPVIYRAIME
ncbi:lysine-specific demethylase 4A isoform X1 [Plectropomus leopardus]|uniref:lysine-specific demethylase 4A isoform X1 n=1 Tax=Plectropomus leopardus TaxID=160734 RepID=UPI001C4DB957|nr:lysine-specific demethylase 4A isoform X1 [Plectropomus leopardus]XP_042368663.1 lysine-specific demethylase 4A isoform X1 [Plectropomus leopardus]XP_042368671.1 lysine-specific demethylase 4A isoform X1 [Plectropomus leopardus]XP_042368678.1 lysine-specific demethylase 4A isoform X1 [Plectropomus leopardus]